MIRPRRAAPEAGEPSPVSLRTTALRLVEAAGWFVACLLAGVVGLVVVGWLIVRAPSPDDLATTQLAEITYADGTRLAMIKSEGVQNRIKVDLGSVPLPVRNAVLAAEDRSFRLHPGFDASAIVRAAISQLTGGAGGGSTITQQYIKNATGDDAQSVLRKYRELIAAAKLSQRLTKDEILQRYLNTIYFGRGAYGIQAAARAYFGISADRLTLDQGALLAGLIQAPSRYDPAENPRLARERWTYVLDGMVEQRWLTPVQRAAARFPDTVAARPPTGGIPTDHLGHIYTRVRSELTDLGFTEQEVSRAGLRVVTTIDPDLQRYAADAARRGLAGQPERLRAALVAQEPATGAIVAYYGGENGIGLDYAQALRQPGSTFKPFVLTAALREAPPIGLGTEYDGTSPQVIAGRRVTNSDGDSCPSCDLQTAMTRSINTVFYRLAVDVGPVDVARAARDAGIPARLLADPTAGLALGSEEVSPAHLAAAYATFATGGVHHRPHLIARVEDRDGGVLYQARHDGGQRRFTEQVARNVTESLLDVAAASGIPLAGGRPAAAKTGTTEGAVAGTNKDAWTVGYTPGLVSAAWVGTDDNSPITTAGGRPIYGRMVPGEMWQRFTSAALRGRPVQDFGPFEPLGEPVGRGSDEDDEDEDRDRDRDDEDEDEDRDEDEDEDGEEID